MSRILMVGVSLQAHRIAEYIRMHHEEIEAVVYFNPTKIMRHVPHQYDQNKIYVVPSLVKMKRIRMRKTLLYQQHRYTGCLADCLNDRAMKDFDQFLFSFLDQMEHGFQAKHSQERPLTDLYEYMDYLYLASDHIGQKLIKNKIDTVVFLNVPYVAWDFLIFRIAQLLNLRTLMLEQSLFPGRLFSAHTHVDFGKFDDVQAQQHQLSDSAESCCKALHCDAKKNIQNPMNTRNFPNAHYYILIRYIFSKLPHLLIYWSELKRLLTKLPSIKTHFLMWKDPFSFYFLRKKLDYFSEIVQHETRDIDWAQSYVYCDLQKTCPTSVLEGDYIDQTLMIEHLAQIVPHSYKIYVKADLNLKSCTHYPLFLNRLRRLKQVVILPSGADTSRLIDHAVFVATTTGIVGWEAIHRGQCVVTFGHVWYNSFVGVFPFSSELSFEQVIQYQIDHDELAQQVNRFLRSLPEGIIGIDDIQQQHILYSNSNLKRVSRYLIDLVLDRKKVLFG